MYQDAVRTGDTETAKEIGSVLNSLGSAALQRTGKTAQIRGPIDPKTQKPGLAVYDQDAPEEGAEFVPGVTFPDMNPFQIVQKEGKELDRQAQFLDRYYEQYNKRFTPQVLTAIQSAMKTLPLAMNGDGLAQLSIVTNYLKMLDPTSVVRESEVDNVVKRTASVPQDLWRRLMQLIGRPEASNAPEGMEVDLGPKAVWGSAPLLTQATMTTLARLVSNQYDVLSNAEAQLKSEFMTQAPFRLGADFKVTDDLLPSPIGSHAPTIQEVNRKIRTAEPEGPALPSGSGPSLQDVRDAFKKKNPGMTP
jgi:hypothetical protein